MAADRTQVLRSVVALLAHRPTASMDEIARSAGISQATLHRLVPNRDALVRQLTELALADASSAISTAAPADSEPVEAVRRLVAELAPIADLWAFLVGENQLAELPDLEQCWEELDRTRVDLFRRGHQSRAFRVDLPAEWLSDGLTMLLAGAGWAVHHGRLARRALAELVLNGAVRRTAS